jgi:hypothetical protein
MIRFQLNTLLQWSVEDKDPIVERVLWLDNSNLYGVSSPQLAALHLMSEQVHS